MIKKIFNWHLQEFIMTLIGSLIFCYGINAFIVPNNLYSGGILGISQLIRSVVGKSLNISYDFSGILYYFINVPLLYMAYKNVNKYFFTRTLLAVSIQSLMLSIIPIPEKPIINDLFVNVLAGGIMVGAGAGITLSSGASTGGTDIIGIIVSKHNNKFSIGKLGLMINMCIYVIAGILYGVPTMIYSIIYSAVDSMTVDKLHLQNICSTAFVFCKKNPKVINDFIKNELNRDFTYWDAKGGYDDSRTYIIYTALSKYELQRLERFVKTIDDSLFIVKSEGVGISGEFKKDF